MKKCLGCGIYTKDKICPDCIEEGCRYKRDLIAWYNKEGKIHREDGPAVIWNTGTEMWYLNGKRHREDGPAIEYSSGYKAWCLNGKRHREDGPAVICIDGTKEYWIEGEEYSEEEYYKKLEILI